MTRRRHLLAEIRCVGMKGIDKAGYCKCNCTFYYIPIRQQLGNEEELEEGGEEVEEEEKRRGERGRGRSGGGGERRRIRRNIHISLSAKSKSLRCL